MGSSFQLELRLSSINQDVRRGRCCACLRQWLRHVQGRLRRRRRPQGRLPLHRWASPSPGCHGRYGTEGPRSCSRPSTCPPCTSPSRPCSPCTPLAVPPASLWTLAMVSPTASPSTRVTPSPTPSSVLTWLAVSSPTT